MTNQSEHVASIALPTELLRLVFEFLYAENDKKTLGSCCLLSLQILPFARFYLFYHMGVTALPDDTYNVPNFIMFLKNAPPDIHGYIKKLRISNSGCIGISERKITGIAFDVDSLLPIFQHCSNLHSLILHDIMLVGESIQAFRGQHRTPIFSLKRLVVSDVYGVLETILSLVSVFKRIDSLEILQTSILTVTKGSLEDSPIPDDLRSSLLSHLQIHSLTVEPCYLMPLLTIFQYLPISLSHSLHSLDITFNTYQVPEQIDVIGSFIKIAGPQLEHLRLAFYKIEMSAHDYFSDEYSRHRLPDQLNLSKCVNLQTCQVTFFIGMSEEGSLRDSVLQFKSLLLMLPPLLRLTKKYAVICIGKCVRDDQINTAVDALDWEQLDSVTSETCSALNTKVVFQCQFLRYDAWTSAECAGPLEKIWQETIRRKLPKLNDLARLEFRSENAEGI